MTTGELDKVEPMETDDKAAEPMKNGIQEGEELEEQDEFRAEATFRYDVKNFSRIRESQLSQPCMVRGIPWKIMVMPRDTPRTVRNLGFFLQCNADSDIPNWNCNASATLKLISQNTTIPNHERKIQHMFFPKENDWGFSCFMAWDQVCDPEKGFIKDDTVIFEVTVNADAPHGVHWDSKKHTGYVGLKNQGATCYMNSLLQTLFFTNKLRKSVYQMPIREEDTSKNVALAMQRVFYELQFSEKPVGTKKLTRSFGWDTFDSFLQHDVQELCRVLLDNLEIKMKGSEVEGTIPTLFEGKMKSYIRCKNVHLESKREEPFYDIQLNVKNKKSIQESFQEYIAPELLEGDNKYDAGDHGLQEAEKGIVFLKFPPVLHLQLMRFQYDPDHDMNVKINDRFEFPEKLNLDEFVDPEFLEPKCPNDYTLHAVLVHSGDFHGGHYVVFIDPQGKGRWCKFDDDVVSRCSRTEAIDCNYGGEEDITLPHQRQCTNAYMLVYIRDSAISDVLHTVDEPDIPEPLKLRLEEEREHDAQKKREKNEAHMYMTVNIYLSDAFEGNQGFDLLDHDVAEQLVRKFKLKRDSTVSQFYQLLCETFKMQQNQLRLWPFATRKNSTHRPTALKHVDGDTLVSDQFMGQDNFDAFLELADFTRGAPSVPPMDSDTHVLIFLKYYDPNKRFIVYCGHEIVPLNSKCTDLMPTMCKKVSLPLNQQLLLFEEIRPGMVEKIDTVNTTLEKALSNDLMDGDIIVFQEPADALPDTTEYFKDLYNRIDVTFIDRDEKIQPMTVPCNFTWNYHRVTSALAQRIQCDPAYIQLYKANNYRDISPGPIKFNAEQQALQQMLGMVHRNALTRTPKLLYRKLPLRLDEMETKRPFKMLWMDEKAQQELTLFPEKSGTASTVLDELRRTLSLPANLPLRMLEIHQNRILRECDMSQRIEDLLTRHNSAYRVEQIPPDHLTIDTKTEYLLPVAHFQKETGNTFGTPFFLKVKQGESFASVRERIRKLLEVPEREFEKYKFTLVSPSTVAKTIQFDAGNDYTINLNELTGQYPQGRPWLGLDHLNKNSRRTSAHPLEKAIVIHN